MFRVGAVVEPPVQVYQYSWVLDLVGAVLEPPLREGRCALIDPATAEGAMHSKACISH